MILAKGLRRITLAAAVAAVFAGALPASAQEVTEEQIRAARAAISAIHATDLFDAILPDAAAALKSTLIQKNPDMQDISSALWTRRRLRSLPAAPTSSAKPPRSMHGAFRSTN